MSGDDDLPGAVPQIASSAMATLAALARPRDLRDMPMSTARLVIGLRLATLYDRAGRDPVPDLACRYRSVELAVAIDTLMRAITRCWPEPLLVNRPCCAAMNPDEATLAGMMRAARSGDQPAFSRQIDGFVRADRHDLLYRATLHAAALMGDQGNAD